MSELNDDMWEQIELNNYGKGKLVHIVNEQAELIRSLYEQLYSAHREGWEQGKREAREHCFKMATNGANHDMARHSSAILSDIIAAMEYKEKANE